MSLITSPPYSCVRSGCILRRGLFVFFVVPLFCEFRILRFEVIEACYFYMVTAVWATSSLSCIRCRFPYISAGSTLPPNFFCIAFNDFIRGEITVLFLISLFCKIRSESSKVIKPLLNFQICTIWTTAVNASPVADRSAPCVPTLFTFPPCQSA